MKFIEVTDIPSPSTPIPASEQSQVVTATKIGGPVATSIPNGETTGTALISPATPVPSENGGASTHPASSVASLIAGTGPPNRSVGNGLTTPTSLGTPLVNESVPTVGETGTTIISAPTTPTIATTGITSVPPSVISE